MKKIGLIPILIMCIGTFVFGQSAKKIVKEGIKTKIEWKYSGDEKIKNSQIQYDLKGNIIEKIEYDKEGNMKKKITQEFNDKNEIIRKISYLPNGKINKKIIYKYENGLKVFKTEYDLKRGRISKKEYQYLTN